MQQQEVYQGTQPQLRKFPFYIRRSTYIHIALVIVALVSGKVILMQQQQLRDANIELVQASVKVDVVAMPNYTPNELKNLSSGVEEAKKEEVSATAAPLEKVENEEKREAQGPQKVDAGPSFEEANSKKRLDFLSKLKKIGNKKIKSDGNQNAEKGLYGEKVNDLKELVLAGNKLNVGTALRGEGSTVDMTAYQVYASRLPDIVRPHWSLPSFLMNKNLKARVRVWLAMSGEVTRAEIYQSSGDSEYDQRAIEAIKSSSPFPRLSEEVGRRGVNGNIILGFPL